MTAPQPRDEPATSRSAPVFRRPSSRERASGRRTQRRVESLRPLVPAGPDAPDARVGETLVADPDPGPPPRAPTVVAQPPRWEPRPRTRITGDARRSPRDRSAARDLPARGTDLTLGRYRLLERLGTGGFGVVWRAYDELLRREVAVKRIPLGPGGDSGRASREALASARLSHPAIVGLYEASAVGEDFYLISELVDGQTLAQLIASHSLAHEAGIEIGIALADALSHAHSRGVIHRDVKPQNVLVPHRLDDPGAPAQLK